MNIEDMLTKIPNNIQDLPIVQAMTQLIRGQAEQIQHQIEQIQGQAEQITKLNETIEFLKDEIDRLNKTPSRPKFKPNRLEPRSRGKKKNGLSNNFFEKTVYAPENKYKEVIIKAKGVPQGSRLSPWLRATATR